MHSQSFEKMNELVKEYGQDGLVFLSIFKSLKNNAIQELSKKDKNIFNREKEINKTCISIAKDVFKRVDKNPSEHDIERVLLILKEIESHR